MLQYLIGFTLLVLCIHKNMNLHKYPRSLDNTLHRFKLFGHRKLEIFFIQIELQSLSNISLINDAVLNAIDL